MTELNVRSPLSLLIGVRKRKIASRPEITDSSILDEKNESELRHRIPPPLRPAVSLPIGPQLPAVQCAESTTPEMHLKLLHALEPLLCTNLKANGSVRFANHVLYSSATISSLQPTSLFSFEKLIASSGLFVSACLFDFTNASTWLRFSEKRPPEMHKQCLTVTRKPAAESVNEPNDHKFAKSRISTIGGRAGAEMWRIASEDSKSSTLSEDDILLGNVHQACVAAISATDFSKNGLEFRVFWNASRGCYSMTFRNLGSLDLVNIRRIHDAQPYHVEDIVISNNKQSEDQLSVLVRVYDRPIVDGWNHLIVWEY